MRAVASGRGRRLRTAGALRTVVTSAPGALRQAGLAELLALTPDVTLLADAGHQGLSA